MSREPGPVPTAVVASAPAYQPLTSVVQNRTDRRGRVGLIFTIMDTNTLIIIVLVVLLLGGGGFFFRGRR